jgi:diguanylate cyclase (GGDEF)-like protein
MVSRTSERSEMLDAVVEERFERVGTVSTIAVARWMAGEGPEVAREVGQECWLIFGVLAAQHAVPLNEVTKRCLRWWNAAEEMVREIAAELQIPQEVCAHAMSMLQRSFSVTLVRMCECFEAERSRTDEERTQREEELTFMATHDALTKLPNRALILDRLEQMLVRSRHSQMPVAALFIDLDDFKSINDTFGHNAGDELLCAVATRLAGVVRDVDALGRLSGDEFVLLAADMSPAAGPEALAERVLDALRQPFTLGDAQTPVIVTASIGIEVDERLSAGELLRDADVAMYRAKWAGKDRYFMFKNAPKSPNSHRRGRWRNPLKRLGLVHERGVRQLKARSNASRVTPTDTEVDWASGIRRWGVHR